MASFMVVWLDRESKARRKTTRRDEASARDLVRELTAKGHDDVRYRRPGERAWRGVRSKGSKGGGVKRQREVPFPPTVAEAKAQKLREPTGSDALDKRLPGSFESGKRK
jgi:hypothetical protein